MIGLDYHSASIELREKISLTEGHVIKKLNEINKKYSVGVVIISTCNRTEIYISTLEDITDELLVSIYNDVVELDAPYYTKTNKSLIKYLFELSCGLHSMILGEDQIITQVNNAIALSVEQNCSESSINTLFRHAVTCAKKAKTDVNIKHISPSIVSEAIEILKRESVDYECQKALVIGNGEMGRLSAKLLHKEGFKVYMTLRSYKYKAVDLPDFCITVDYDKREELFDEMDVIVSATKSPHYTISNKAYMGLKNKEKFLFDLALPRDIEPEIKNIKGVKCFDVDDIGKNTSTYNEKDMQSIKLIINEQISKFFKWYTYYVNLRSVKV